MEFNAVWREYAPAITRLAASYERNEHKREELLQEIALAVWQALGQCKEQQKLKHFVLRIAHNKAVDHVSREVRLPTQNETEFDTLVASAPAQHNARQQALLSAMYRLPINQRQVLALLFEGLSYQDIADVTGIELNHVGVMINRAKHKLTEYLNHDQ